jgi:hypothetical protein
MSRRHSCAAGLVMWARGSLAVPGAAEIMIPVKPWEARKHAREAPAGPAPTTRYGVSMMGPGAEGGGLPFGRVLVAILIYPVCSSSDCDPSGTLGCPRLLFVLFLVFSGMHVYEWKDAIVR